jgi:hypothetical protein
MLDNLFSFLNFQIIQIRYFLLISVLSMSSCEIMQHNGELTNNSYSIVEQDGKSLWLIYRDSTGKNYENENGVHKIKYSSYKFFGKTTFINEFYTIKGDLLDTSSVLGYSKSVSRFKNGNYVEFSYFDKNEDLVMPSYIKYAKMTQKYYRNGSWRVRYFDKNNNLICYNNKLEQHLAWDTLWIVNEIDTTFFLSIKCIKSVDCKIKNE